MSGPDPGGRQVGNLGSTQEGERLGLEGGARRRLGLEHENQDITMLCSRVGMMGEMFIC